MSTSTVLRGGRVLDVVVGTWQTADLRIGGGTMTAGGPDPRPRWRSSTSPTGTSCQD